MLRFARRAKTHLINLFRQSRRLDEIHIELSRSFREVATQLNALNERIEAVEERLPNALDAISLSSEERTDAVKIAPDTDIPFAVIDTSKAFDPVQTIMNSAEFMDAVRFFAASPSRAGALVSPHSQALLYNLIRLLRPERVVEIGTYKASTTEAIARALLLNGRGVVHTIDPFNAKRIRSILASWPPELRQYVTVHSSNSMQFFARMERLGHQADIVFVDGNHDYEFALFDIESAARFIRPNGFIVVDNIAQPGPYMASRDFLARRGGWREYGVSPNQVSRGLAYDADRSRIRNTDFCILRAPAFISINERPITPGILAFSKPVGGLRIEIAEPTAGRLYVQCIVRIFGTPPIEYMKGSSIEISHENKSIDVTLPIMPPGGPDVNMTVEPWLYWHGAQALQLACPPRLF